MMTFLSIWVDNWTGYPLTLWLPPDQRGVVIQPADNPSHGEAGS